MAELRCVDGTVLTVLPVPCLDRGGVPYEVTLQLVHDGAPLGEVGERCGFFLATAAARLRDVRAADPEAFPAGAVEAGVRTWASNAELDPDAAWRGLARHLPRDCELFAFRSRDPDDLSVAGELRVVLRDERRWVPPEADSGRGRWRLRTRAVVEAWGADGTGTRAVLDSGGLQAFLDQLLADCAAIGASYAGEGVARPGG